MPPPEDLRLTDPSVPSRSCCCPARPMVTVVLPATSGRPGPVDLWLCGHHYRASLGALLAAGADIEELAVPDSRPGAADAATLARQQHPARGGHPPPR